MIYHNWTVICSKSSIDSETNNISIFEVIEQITFHGDQDDSETTGIPISLQVLTLWSRGEDGAADSNQSRLRLLAPDGSTILTTDPVRIDLTSYQRYRMRNNLHGLPFSGLGIYKFVIELLNESNQEWEKVKVILFPIISKPT